MTCMGLAVGSGGGPAHRATGTLLVPEALEHGVGGSRGVDLPLKAVPDIHWPPLIELNCHMTCVYGKCSSRCCPPAPRAWQNLHGDRR